jgi:hypothetical protein
MEPKMNTSTYFDIASEPSEVTVFPDASTAYQILPVRPEPLNRQKIVPLTLVLKEALFTGCVTSANWTFVISMQDKLWISKKTSLYFGKTARLNRPVYRGPANIIDHKLSLNLSVTAYNMYGSVIRSSQQVQFYFLEGEKNDDALFQFEQNHNSMTLKFAALLGKKEPVAA